MSATKKTKELADSVGINLSFELSEDFLPTAPELINQEDLDTTAALDYRSVLSEDKTKINYSEIVKNSPYKIVFLGDKRKLNRVSIQSMMIDTGLVLGKQETDANGKPSMKRYSILKPETRIEIKSEKDPNIGFLLACFSEPSFFGSVNGAAPYLFKIVSVKKESEMKGEQANDFFKAMEIVTEVVKSETSLSNFGVLLGIPGFRVLNLNDKKAAIAKLAQENPKAILEMSKASNKKEMLFFHEAKQRKIIVEKNGIYKYRGYDLGITVEKAVEFLIQNEEIKMLIESEMAK